MKRTEVSPQILARLRPVCLALPETREELAWVGTRWRIRQQTFAHVLVVASGWPPAYAQLAARLDAADGDSDGDDSAAAPARSARTTRR